MKKLLILVLLAGCTPQGEHEGMSMGKNLKIAHTQPAPGEMLVQPEDEAGMLAEHIISQQSIELLYIEKVYPAVKACLDRGLVKDPEGMLALNKFVDSELDQMGVAGKHFRKYKDQASLDAWQVHHDNAYHAMGKMLDMTGQVPVHVVPPKKVPRDDVTGIRTVANATRSGNHSVSNSVQLSNTASRGTKAQ
jgi:hypothetical protein